MSVLILVADDDEPGVAAPLAQARRNARTEASAPAEDAAALAEADPGAWPGRPTEAALRLKTGNDDVIGFAIEHEARAGAERRAKSRAMIWRRAIVRLEKLAALNVLRSFPTVWKIYAQNPAL